MIDLINTVLEDMEDACHNAWSGVTSVYEVFKLKSSPYNMNREQTGAKSSSSHPVCGTTCIDKIWLHLELSSYANPKFG